MGYRRISGTKETEDFLLRGLRSPFLIENNYVTARESRERNNMSETFTPINTQEEFDTAIKDRLGRQEAKIRGEYTDYDELKKQSKAWETDKQTYETTIAENKKAYEDLNNKYMEATGKIAQYETDALKTKVAIESGLPVAMFSYLKGTTEEEIRSSAEELGKFTKGGQVTPLADPEADPPKDKKQAAMRKMLRELRGE